MRKKANRNRFFHVHLKRRECTVEVRHDSLQGDKNPFSRFAVFPFSSRKKMFCLLLRSTARNFMSVFMFFAPPP